MHSAGVDREPELQQIKRMGVVAAAVDREPLLQQIKRMRVVCIVQACCHISVI